MTGFSTQELAPDVGALVEYGESGFNTGPGEYLVTAWMRLAPTPALAPDDFVGQMLHEACQEIRDPRDGTKHRMQFCLREEATHLALSGVAGAIAPISMCKVTGMVGWSPAELREARTRAACLGASHEMLF